MKNPNHETKVGMFGKDSFLKKYKMFLPAKIRIGSHWNFQAACVSCYEKSRHLKEPTINYPDLDNIVFRCASYEEFHDMVKLKCPGCLKETRAYIYRSDAVNEWNSINLEPSDFSFDSLPSYERTQYIYLGHYLIRDTACSV